MQCKIRTFTLLYSAIICLFTCIYLRGDHHSRYSHEGMVHESPAAGSLQHVVQVVLQPPVAHVSAATLRAVDERLPQQAQAGPLLSALVLRTCRRSKSGRHRAVPRPVHPSAGLHIFQGIASSSAMPRRILHPEARAAFISAVVAGHGITTWGRECAAGSAVMHI